MTTINLEKRAKILKRIKIVVGVFVGIFFLQYLSNINKVVSKQGDMIITKDEDGIITELMHNNNRIVLTNSGDYKVEW